MSAIACHFRLARPADAAAIAAMSRDLVEAGLGWHYQPGRIRRLIDDPDTVVLLASEGPRPVGFGIMQFGDERAHLVLLAVRGSHHRRGLGRRLLDWLLETALTAGIASVHLELRADNDVARAFYRSAGFMETRLVPRYYSGRESALRMTRLLRKPGLTLPPWQPPTLQP